MGTPLPRFRKPAHYWEHFIKRRDRWLHRMEPQLDRLEDFAANLGVAPAQRMMESARHWDYGLLALCSGFAALVALTML